MNPRLEHANLCVADIDAMLSFLRTAVPEFRVRHDAIDEDGVRWVHVGTEESYLALQQATQPAAAAPTPYGGAPMVNHLAIVVDDVGSLRERMQAAGYQDSTVPNRHPHRKRVYFYDPEGNDWEFVEYLSELPEEKNDYRIMDRE